MARRIVAASALATLLLVLIVPSLVQAQPAANPSAADPPVHLNITTHDQGQPDSRGFRRFWFQVQGLDGPNPTLHLQPGSHVVVHLVNRGNVSESIRFRSPIDATSQVISPGNATTLWFTVPANATGTTYYVDPLHKELGMGGGVSFGTQPAHAPTPAMDRGNLVPFPPKILSEWVTVAGQLSPAVITAIAAAALSWRQNA